MDRFEEGHPLMGGLFLQSALYLARPHEHCHQRKPLCAMNATEDSYATDWKNRPQWPILRANLTLYGLRFVTLHHTFTWHIRQWGWTLQVCVSFGRLHRRCVATMVYLSLCLKGTVRLSVRELPSPFIANGRIWGIAFLRDK